MIITRWKRGFFFWGVIYFVRVVFFVCIFLHRRPDGAVHLLVVFFCWWKAKKRCCLRTGCFRWWIIVVVAAWFVKSLRLTSPSCTEKGVLEAFSVRESHLRHKAKSWRWKYISWPASRSPFSLKTSGLTHAQNQPPFVHPPPTTLFLSC